MKTAKLSLALLVAIVALWVSGCSDEDDAASSSSGGSSGSSGGASTPTQIVTADGFYMLFDPGVPEVIDSDYAFTQQEVTVTAYVTDVFDLPVTSGKTIVFETEWGDWIGSTGNACVTDSSGSCSVTWRTGDPATIPPDCRADITAWTTGEEFFEDTNANNQLDATESFTSLSEPFLDVNGNGVYDASMVTYENVVEFMEFEGFPGSTAGVDAHDPADAKYTGTRCSTAAQAANLCTTETSMVIHTQSNILLTKNDGELESAWNPAFDVNNDGDTNDTIRRCNFNVLITSGY